MHNLIIDYHISVVGKCITRVLMMFESSICVFFSINFFHHGVCVFVCLSACVFVCRLLCLLEVLVCLYLYDLASSKFSKKIIN